MSSSNYTTRGSIKYVQQKTKSLPSYIGTHITILFASIPVCEGQ